MFRIALLSSVALVALTMPTAADPVTLITAGVNALVAAGGFGTTVATIGGTTLTIGSIVGTAAVAAGAIALSFLSQPGKQTIDPGQAKEQFDNAEMPEIRAVGRVRLGGLKAFGNVNGYDRYRLIFHCKGAIDGVEEYWLGSREVTVEEDGSVSSPPYVKPGGSWIFIREKNGSGGETAWSVLLDAFPSLWTPAHQAQGIAQSLVTYSSPGVADSKYLKLYGSGLPDLEKVMRAELVYDPRTGATAWSDNGILVAMHVYLSFPGAALSDFDLAFMAAEADRADALVATNTRPEKRSRAWGVWTSETARGDTLKQVLQSVGAEQISLANNTIGFRLIDDARPSELSIDMKHIVDLKWKGGPDGVERPNLCIVKYYSPERNYELTEIDMTGIGWAKIQSEIDEVGEKQVSFELPFCPSAAQAQRIARQLFALARADSGTLTTNMVGLACWGLRGITIPFPDIDFSAVCAIGSARPNDDAGTVEIPFTVWPTLDAFNPAADEAAAPAAIPPLDFPSDVNEPYQPTGAVVVTYLDGSKEIRTSYAPVPGATQLEATYRTYAGDVRSTWHSMTEVDLTTGDDLAYAAVASVPTAADFRLRAFDASGDGSNWSPMLNAASLINNAAPSAPTFGGDDGTSIVVADNLNVAYVTTTGINNPGSFNVRPGSVQHWGDLSGLSPGTYTLTATAHASDGTASASATYTLIVSA